MLEKYIDKLPYGINLIDILFGLFLMLFLLHIINTFKRRRISKEISNIPGLDINQKILSDIKDINERIEKIHRKNTEFDLNIQNLRENIKKIKKINFVKYNPYQDMGVGGKQSFSIVFVNENGDGIILTNLYSRERTRVLLKDIKTWNPSQELTPEEKKLLEETKNK